jgi:hypothetical protein
VAVGVPKDRVKQTCLQIQTCITWTFSAGWKERCHRVWTARREQRLIEAAAEAVRLAAQQAADSEVAEAPSATAAPAAEEILAYRQDVERYYTAGEMDWEAEVIAHGNVPAPALAPNAPDDSRQQHPRPSPHIA